MPESDAQLLDAALSGSERASRELVRRYERPVFNLIVRMVRQPSIAEDLAQETFVKVFTHLSSYDSRWKLANWILKIAHNTTIDYLRRIGPPTDSLDVVEEGDRPVQPVSATPSPLAVTERHELADALDAAIDRLRPEYRHIVILRYQEDLSYEEIAEVVGLPLGTVKSHLFRARAELANLMEAAGWGRRCNPA